MRRLHSKAVLHIECQYMKHNCDAANLILLFLCHVWLLKLTAINLKPSFALVQTGSKGDNGQNVQLSKMICSAQWLGQPDVLLLLCKTVGVGAENHCQVWFMSELRDKSNKI